VLTIQLFQWSQHPTKHYIDDTFTILDRSNIGHLNSEQSTIGFTMETEKDNKIAFLDPSVSRELNNHLIFNL